MIRVGVTGVCGRMGSRVAALVREAKDMQLASAIERPSHPRIGAPVSDVIGGGPLPLVVSPKIGEGLDVIIDFSSPEATVGFAEECARRRVALVSGTTGLDEEQVRRLRAAAAIIPCLWSPNMSVGVNVLFRLTEQVAKALGDEYDVEIVEMHHRFKKDAPSGTAKRLAEKVAAGLGRNLEACAVYGREGLVGERRPEEIGIHAVRGGDVVGDHMIIFSTLGERIELVHRAHSRDVFAHGALRAARFIVGKSPGMYEMADVLGLRG